MEVEHGPLNDHFPLTNSIWFFQGVYAPSPATTELSTGRPAQASKASMESFLHRRNLGVDVFLPVAESKRKEQLDTFAT